MKDKKTSGEKAHKPPKKKIPDRHLDTPAEANRDKHINFTALENDESDPADQPATGKLANNSDPDKDVWTGIPNQVRDKFLGRLLEFIGNEGLVYQATPAPCSILIEDNFLH